MPPSPPRRQSTISELFESSQPKRSGSKPEKVANKRIKTSHAADDMATVSDSAGPPRSTQKKASASGQGDRNRTVVDLTTSPGPPPQLEMWDGSCKKGPSEKASSFRIYGGARRIPIKNLKSPSRTGPEELLRRAWEPLDAALTAIFAGQRIGGAMEELYRSVESVCRHQAAEALAKKVRFRCAEHVKDHIWGQLSRMLAQRQSDLVMLRAVYASWRRWSEQLVTVRSVFFYLDRSYLISSDEPTLEDMCRSQFRHHVLYQDGLKPVVLRSVCNLVDDARNGARDPSHESTLRDAIRMMHDLMVYTIDLEPALLMASTLYFQRWAEEESSTRGLASYVERCGRLTEGEKTRCDVFAFDASTRRELLAALEDQVLRRKVDFLVDIGQVSNVLDAEATTVLKLLYELLQRVRCEKRLHKAWEAYIKSTGASILNGGERSSETVVQLLELKTKVDRIWKVALHKHEGLGLLLRESFASFINERRAGTAASATQASPGEMIAKYIDTLMRGGVKAIPPSLSTLRSDDAAADVNCELDTIAGDEDAEINWQLDQALDLFRFIEGKDVFEAFYKRDLARRLLMARSASADAERSMLTRLRNECGAAFTHNLEQMFKDVDLARDEMASYKQIQEDSSRRSKLDLSVNVLCSAAWPSYPDIPVSVPPEILSAIEAYDRFYKQKHTGRSLSWKHSLAHCVVRARFSRGTKELLVSSFQALVLLLFNGMDDRSSLAYQDIQAGTGLPESEVGRTLQSLACARYQVLKKEPKGREVATTDSFSVNVGFSDAKYRIKINQIQLRETREEYTATHEDVSRDRQYEAQAAIVRIMKSRKAISAPELMAETISLTKNRGALDTSEIKKQIDKLIEKEYIERVLEDKRMMYKYLA